MRERPRKYKPLPFRMRSWRFRLQSKGMQLAAHIAPQRLIDQLVLLNPRLALESRRDDGRRVVIAIARQVLDGHFGVGQSLLDQALDFLGMHGHGVYPSCLAKRYRRKAVERNYMETKAVQAIVPM